MQTRIHIDTRLVTLESNEHHVMAAKNIKEDKELIAVGFEYGTEIDGVKNLSQKKIMKQITHLESKPILLESKPS